MCGFDKGGGGVKNQPKLGLLITQRKSDVLILINFISIFHIAESMYNHESLLDNYIVFRKEPIKIYLPTGPAKIWLWLARRPFGWPRASGKHDPCNINIFLRKSSVYHQVRN